MKLFNTVEEANDFMQKLDALIPGFTAKVEEKLAASKKEEENKKMLQEEQNLQEVLKAWEKCKDKYANAKEEDGNQLLNLRGKLSSLREEVSDIEVKIDNLERDLNDNAMLEDEADNYISRTKQKLEEIHKKWIAANPAKTTEVLKKNIVREAFEALWNMKFTVDDDYNTLFKRFDNLVHARCKTTTMFGYDFNITDASNILSEAGYHKLALEIWNINQRSRQK